MEFIDLREEVARLAAAGEPERAGGIEAILELWPECRGFRSQWGDLRICCREANQEVNQLELEHQAIEHDHHPLEVWPFVSIGPHDRLYSDPPCFVVADAPRLGFGEIPRSSWQDLLEAAGVGAIVISKVADYLDKHQPVLWESDNDRDDEEPRGNS